MNRRQFVSGAIITIIPSRVVALDEPKAIRILDEFRKLPVERQQIWRRDIIRAFQVFWSTQPSRKDFAKHTAGLVLFPEIIYDMVMSPKRAVYS